MEESYVDPVYQNLNGRKKRRATTQNHEYLMIQLGQVKKCCWTEGFEKKKCKHSNFRKWNNSQSLFLQLKDYGPMKYFQVNFQSSDNMKLLNLVDL